MYVFISKDRMRRDAAPFVQTKSSQVLMKQRKLLIVAGLLALVVYSPFSYMVAKGAANEWPKVVHGSMGQLLALSFMAGWGHVKLERHDLPKAAGLAALAAGLNVVIYVICLSRQVDFPLFSPQHPGDVWWNGFGMACVSIMLSLLAIYLGAWLAKSLTLLLSSVEEMAPAIARMFPLVFMICVGTVVLNLVFASAYMQFHDWNVPAGAVVKDGDYSDHVFLAFHMIFGGAADYLLSNGPPRRIVVILHVMLFAFWIASFLQILLSRISTPHVMPAELRSPAPTRSHRSRVPAEKAAARSRTRAVKPEAAEPAAKAPGGGTAKTSRKSARASTPKQTVEVE